MSELNKLAVRLYETAKANGWYPTDTEFRVTNKIYEELEEARHELDIRQGRLSDPYYEELVDVLITVLARLGKAKLEGDIESIAKMVLTKNSINRNRGWRHENKEANK